MNPFSCPWRAPHWSSFGLGTGTPLNSRLVMAEPRNNTVRESWERGRKKLTVEIFWGSFPPWREKNEQEMKFPPIPPVVLLRPVPPLQGCVSSEGHASTASIGPAQRALRPTSREVSRVLPNRLPRLLLNMQLRQQRTKWLRQPSTQRNKAITDAATRRKDNKKRNDAMRVRCKPAWRGHNACRFRLLVLSPCPCFSGFLCVLTLL